MEVDGFLKIAPKIHISTERTGWPAGALPLDKVSGIYLSTMQGFPLFTGDFVSDIPDSALEPVHELCADSGQEGIDGEARYPGNEYAR